MPGAGRCDTSPMAPRIHRPATFADIADLPEDLGAEIVDGRVVYKASPSYDHGDAQASVVAALRTRFHSRDGGWWIVS